MTRLCALLLFVFQFFLSYAQGGYLTIDGLKMYYETHGSGEPLLILHGGTASSSDMRALTDYFSEDYLVIVNDRQAHGKTADGTGELSYEKMTSNIIALLDYLSVDSINVVGYSDGGVVALNMAINYPERVKSAVYIATNYHHDGISKAEKEWIRNADLDRKIQTLWLTAPTYSTEDLSNIKCPSLVLIGDRDGLKLNHTLSFYQSIENAQMCILPNTSHEIIREKAALVCDIISAFLTH